MGLIEVANMNGAVKPAVNGCGNGIGTSRSNSLCERKPRQTQVRIWGFQFTFQLQLCVLQFVIRISALQVLKLLWDVVLF